MAAIDPRAELVKQLMPLLLAGEDPCLARLRSQWQASEVAINAETNWGFYADFTVADSEDPVDPPNFAGGNAVIEVEGVANNAGCILYVKEGKLRYLEVYTYDEPWEAPPRFGAITQHVPVVPGEGAARAGSASGVRGEA